jgi:hypothetical protein
MAINCFLDASPSAPDHGDTLSVTYSVTGNDPVAPSSARITGSVVVGGVSYDVSTTITLPGSPAADVSYEVPECDDLTFTVSPDDPSTFTAVVP